MQKSVRFLLELAANKNGRLMNPDGQKQVQSERARLMARAGLAAALTVAGLSYVALEGFFYKLPIHPSNQPRVIWLILYGPIACFVLKNMERIRPYDPELADLAKWILAFSDKLKQVVISRFTTISVFLLTGLIGFCVVWIPQFLIQPLWTDHEHVLVMARLWDLGEFPWTAMRTYQFPGEMEIAWLSAKLFGWGYPPGFFLMDMMIMGTLCITLIYWSARQLGHWRYGVLAVIGLISYESTLPFTGVAQRDAHATELAMLAFCLPGVLQKRRLGDVFSGIAFALGMAIRPHVILFVPMIITGIWWSESTESERLQRETGYFRNILKRVLILSASALIAGLIFFEPVLGQWRTPEFLAALQFPLQQDSAYNRGIFVEWVDAVKTYYVIPRHFWYIIFCIWMVVGSRNKIWKQRGLVLLLIALTGGLYRMVHPVDHGYLKQPLMILECIGLAVLPAWLMIEMKHFQGLTWFAVTGLMLYTGQVESTIYAELSYTPIAYEALLNGTYPPYSPPGCRAGYPNNGNYYHYHWPDWIEADAWLRVESTRETRILNLLSYQPFPSFLGTVDRLPIGRLESLILMNWFTKYDFDSEISKDLENADVGSLVVWDSIRTNPMNIPQLRKSNETIRRLYEKRMDFGEIEFWEKLAPY